MTFNPAYSISMPGTPATHAQRLYNFSAGPSMLPEDVLRQAQEDIWNIRGSGMGIMEHSHRAKLYDTVLAEALADCRKVGSIPGDYEVIFTTGGATTQNSMVPQNLLSDGGVADYITTGYWAERSIEECQVFGKPHEAFTGKPTRFDHIPSDDEIRYSPSPEYVHICSNNTIYGTQWRDAAGAVRTPRLPPGVPLVCDMCSDIFSRPVEISRFALVYAGAQKNIGIAGASLVIIRKDLVERYQRLVAQGKKRPIPTMSRYDVLARDESRHNTPPVFPIYVCGLMFRWILAQGGTPALLARNVQKAQALYDVLDASKFYRGLARADSRSLMNITFATPSPRLDDLFAAEALAEGMDNLRGHRATGGIRASVYNAMPMDGARALASFMREFERRHG